LQKNVKKFLKKNIFIIQGYAVHIPDTLVKYFAYPYSYTGYTEFGVSVSRVSLFFRLKKILRFLEGPYFCTKFDLLNDFSVLHIIWMSRNVKICRHWRFCFLYLYYLEMLKTLKGLVFYLIVKLYKWNSNFDLKENFVNN